MNRALDPAIDPQQAHVVKEWAHDSPLIACRFDPSGRFVFATGQDNLIIRWDLESEAKTTFTAHDSWVRGLEFTPDGSQLISGGFDGRLCWWQLNADEPQLLRQQVAHEGWIRAAQRSPDDRYLVTGGNDCLVKVWDLETGELKQTLSGHEKHVYSVTVHPTEPWVLSGDLGGVVHQWDWQAGTLMRSFKAETLHTYNGGQQVDFGGVRSLTVRPDSHQLACGGLFNASNPLGAVHEPIIVLFDWESAEPMRSLITGDLKGGIWRQLYHPAGFLMAASGGSSGGFLLFWQGVDEKGEDVKDFHRLKLPHLARDMDLHPDQVRVATSHFDSKLRITRLAAPA